MTTIWRRHPNQNYPFIASLCILGVLFASFPGSACAPTAPSKTVNITITVPQGTSDHSNPKLICTPSTWIKIATFFLANFVTHTATIKSVPGESALSASEALVLTLLLPASSLRRGLDTIYQRAVLADTPLKTAAKAKALCMVVRNSKWRPRAGDVVEVLDYMEPCQFEKITMHKSDFVFKITKEKKRIDGKEWDWIRIDHKPGEVLSRSQKYENLLYKVYDRLGLGGKEKEQKISEIPALAGQRLWGDEEIFDPLSSSLGFTSRKVHGICRLPEGYSLIVVPREAKVDENHYLGKATCTSELSSNYNLPKALTAIFQTLYASFTLYQVKGDQIQRYGYAAFGLTVTPYLIMSIVNLLSTILTPDYPAMYLVSSEVMDEARRREGSRFEGIVGVISNHCTSKKSSGKVKFEVNQDGRIFVLGFDSESRWKVPTEVEIDGKEPLINLRTGRFMRGLLARHAHRVHNRTIRPFLLIPRSLGTTSDVLQEPYYVRSLLLWADLAVCSITIAVIGVLSHFKTGQSTHAQRSWIMTWIAFGVIIGAQLSVNPRSQVRKFWLYYGLWTFPCLAPSIGGFVVVGQMLMQYGNCIEL